MRILVGDLAQLYGLSNQTLHYYENKRILRPRRDIRTGYRYYESSDLQRLGTIKKYRNAGFSLGEGERLCSENETSVIAGAYIRKRRTLQRQIELMQLTTTRMDEELNLYERFQSQQDHVWVEELAGFYRFEVKGSGEEIIIQNEDTRQEAVPWFSNIFFTSASERYYMDKLGAFSHFTRGMLADRHTTQLLKIPVNTPHVQELQAGPYACFMMQAESTSRVQETFNRTIEVLRDLNRSAAGAPFTRAVMACRGTPEHSCVLRQVLIPLKS